MYNATKSHPLNNNIPFQCENNSDEFSNRHQNIDHYYNLENSAKAKNFSCDSCNKDFYSHGQFKKHIEEHVQCPFPECGLKACVKLIDQHITNQHMLVNFESIQIDDEAWRAERKKKFIRQETRARLEAEQLERVKRGERLGKDSSKFAKKVTDKVKGKSESARYDANKDKATGKDSSKKDYKKFNKERKSCKETRETHTNRFKETTIKNKIEEEVSDLEIKLGIPAFKGTKSFYESIGEVSLFGIKSNFLEEDQSTLDISDEEDWNENTVAVEPEKFILQNALGSLMDAYSESDTEVNCETVTPKSSVMAVKKENDNIIPENVEAHLKRKKFSENSTNFMNKRKRFRPNRSEKDESRSNHKKTVLDTKFKSNKYRRRILLQKLLEPEIVHERNVILQGIRYIVNNNFFDSQIECKHEDNQTENYTINDQTEIHTINDQTENYTTNDQTENRTITDQTENRTLTDQTENRTLTDQTENHTINDQTENYTINDQTENYTTNDQTENRTITDQTENRTLTDQTENRTLTDQTENHTINDQTENYTINDQTENRTITDQTENRTLTDQTKNHTIKDQTENHK